MITGSKSGIGFETALALARKGAALILPARTRAKADDAAARILEQVPNAQLHPEILDLAARHDAGGSANAICGGCCEGSSLAAIMARMALRSSRAEGVSDCCACSEKSVGWIGCEAALGRI